MSIFKNITFSFHAGMRQFFLYSGSAEKPTEIHNVTMNVEEGIIATYLRTPGILKAPDGSEFMLELTLLPFFREAKQRLLDEAQAKVTAANSFELPPEGSPDAELLAQLTQADRDLLATIFKARKAGQRVSMRYPPFRAEVNFGPVPPKKKEPKLKFPEPVMERGDLKWNEDKSGVDFVPNPEGKSFFESHPKIEPTFNDEVAQQQATGIDPISIANRVPVVVLTLPESDSQQMIVERGQWDAWATVGQSSGRTWLESGKYVAAGDIGCNPEDISEVDFSQTRTREELDNLPDFSY